MFVSFQRNNVCLGNKFSTAVVGVPMHVFVLVIYVILAAR